MTATECGDPVCAARIAVFLHDPTDDLVSEPCSRCVDALAVALGVALHGAGRTMRVVHALAVSRP